MELGLLKLGRAKDYFIQQTSFNLVLHGDFSAVRLSSHPKGGRALWRTRRGERTDEVFGLEMT